MGFSQGDDTEQWVDRSSAPWDETVVSRFADLSQHDDLANDAACRAALNEGEPQPQGLLEWLAANWHWFTTLKPWSATPRGQQRFAEATAEKALRGAKAYVEGGITSPELASENDQIAKHAYTRFLIDRFGPYPTAAPIKPPRKWTPARRFYLLFLGLCVLVILEAWSKGESPPFGPILGAVVFLFLVVFANQEWPSMGRGVGGYRCVVTPAAPPGDTKGSEGAGDNPFGPKLFEVNGYSEASPIEVAALLAKELTHVTTGPSWRVVTTPRSEDEKTVVITANGAYSADEATYLARIGGQFVRVQSLSGKWLGGGGGVVQLEATISLQATISTPFEDKYIKNHLIVELRFFQTTYPMWLRRESEALIARTLPELQRAFQGVFNERPRPALKFKKGDWATWQVVEVYGHGLVQLVPSTKKRQRQYSWGHSGDEDARPWCDSLS